MKLLVVASTIDLKYRLGCTPAWWQLLKAIHESGHEVILTTYLGQPVESLWWRTYPNPCATESVIYNYYTEMRKKRGAAIAERNLFSPLAEQMIKHYIKPKWERHLRFILAREPGIEAILLMNVPLNHINGIATRIKQKWSVPVVYYEGDMPTILPKYVAKAGFKFNYYLGTDLSEYDAFFTNSKGVIADLEARGAKRAYPLYWAVDPGLFTPVDMKKDIDISFFAYGSEAREEWIEKMITIPSQKMPGVRFAVAGGNFEVDLGRAEMFGDITYSEWRNFCCRSKINLNITRWAHANIYASSTSRPFELAAFGACIVSHPHNGIEEWFDIGKEILIVNNEEEAMETYRWLLNNEKEREKIGAKARDRVLKEHTFKHRAEEMLRIINSLKG